MFLIWAIMSDGAKIVGSVYIYMAVCLHFPTEEHLAPAAQWIGIVGKLKTSHWGDSQSYITLY